MSADPRDCKLVLSLHRFGKEPVQIAVGLGPEYSMMPDKEMIECGAIVVAPLEEAVKILKRRELTLENIKDAAEKLGGQMADFLADEGGWHGEDRREATKQHPRRGAWPL